MPIIGSLVVTLPELAALTFFGKEHNMADRNGACHLLNRQTSQVYLPDDNGMGGETISTLLGQR